MLQFYFVVDGYVALLTQHVATTFGVLHERLELATSYIEALGEGVTTVQTSIHCNIV